MQMPPPRFHTACQCFHYLFLIPVSTNMGWPNDNLHRRKCDDCGAALSLQLFGVPPRVKKYIVILRSFTSHISKIEGNHSWQPPPAEAKEWPFFRTVFSVKHIYKYRQKSFHFSRMDPGILRTNRLVIFSWLTLSKLYPVVWPGRFLQSTLREF